LTQIADGLEGGTLAGNLVSPAAGVGEVQLASEIDSLRREVVNREVHLRTSTPQSTERDEGLAGGEPVAGGERDGDRELRQRLSLAEERALRLERELAEERAARREAEASASALAERDAEVRRLHQLLGDREAQLKVLDGQLAQSEHEVKAMRDAFAQARAGLESLLGDIANDQRAEAADRIASMLRVLRRFEH
jgi:small-conductance mechanosensitive channel